MTEIDCTNRYARLSVIDNYLVKTRKWVSAVQSFHVQLHFLDQRSNFTLFDNDDLIG